MNGPRPSPALWFAEEWTSLLGNVLESLTGERPQLACRAAGPGETPSGAEGAGGQDDVLWFEYRFPLPGDPVASIGAPQDAWTQLAGRVLGAAEVRDALQTRETYLEILQQTLGALSHSAGLRWDREVNVTGGLAAGQPETGECYLVKAAYPDLSLPDLFVVITGNPQDPPAQTESPHSEGSGPDPQETAVSFPIALRPTAAQPKTMDLLMGVELPVCVSFGHVQIPLKDVLKLTAGSIIELNRNVDEPVEVVVNNCVIARGEVVVVEGNYGVRIRQIMTRQQRLESLP